MQEGKSGGTSSGAVFTPHMRMEMAVTPLNTMPGLSAVENVRRHEVMGLTGE